MIRSPYGYLLPAATRRGEKSIPIYDRPTKSLMKDWAKANLTPNQTFSKSDVVFWFAEHYPKIKHSTIATHVEFMSVNNSKLNNYPVVKPARPSPTTPLMSAIRELRTSKELKR